MCNIMKFLTRVSTHCVISLIPAVTYFKLKINALLCYVSIKTWSGLSRSVVHNYIPPKKWFIDSISIVQN